MVVQGFSSNLGVGVAASAARTGRAAKEDRAARDARTRTETSRMRSSTRVRLAYLDVHSLDKHSLPEGRGICPGGGGQRLCVAPTRSAVGEAAAPDRLNPTGLRVIVGSTCNKASL